MKTAIVSFCAVALLLGNQAVKTATKAPAKLKPVAVVSFAGYDALKADVALVGRLSNNPHLDDGLEALLKLATKNQGLAGLDTTRPWGLAIQTNGKQVGGHLFVPVDDLEQLLGVVGPMAKGVDELGDGVFKINTQDKPLFVTEKPAGWAMVCNKRAHLRYAPDDPIALLDGLNERYDLAGRLLLRNVPEKHRQELIDKIKKDAAADMAQRPDEDDTEYAVRKAVSEKLLAALIGTAEQLDEITIGVTLDADAEQVSVELSATAVPDSRLAEELGKLDDARSQFAGFAVPDATLCFSKTGQMLQDDMAELAVLIDTVEAKAMAEIDAKNEPADKAALEKKVVGTILEAIQQTMADGRADVAATLLADEDRLTALAAVHVADTKRIAATIEQVVEAVRLENPEVVEQLVKLDADQHAGVRMHEVTIPIPPDADNREQTVALIGEQLHVVVGLGKQSVYLAAGRDARQQLKEALDRSQTAADQVAPPMQLTIDVSSLCNFVSIVGDEAKEREEAARAAKILEASGQADRVRLTVVPIENGIRARVVLEPGLLSLIGQAAQHHD